MKFDWRILTPAILLTAVALWQVAETRRNHQSPWIGGGFGMFATVDGSDSRVITVVVDDQQVPVQGISQRLVVATENRPTPEALRILATAAMAGQTVLSDDADIQVAVWTLKVEGLQIRRGLLLAQPYSASDLNHSE